MATTGADGGVAVAHADFKGQLPPLAEPKRSECTSRSHRFERNVDALRGVSRVRGEDRRDMTAGVSDNIGPNRRRSRRDRRATRPNEANRTIARPVVELNAPRAGLIMRTARVLTVGNAANCSEQGARPDSRKASKRNGGERRELAWHAVALLCLALAYLQYYFLDVSLQIAQLPSAAILSVG